MRLFILKEMAGVFIAYKKTLTAFYNLSGLVQKIDFLIKYPLQASFI
jgi:hypothetical protein